MASTALSDLAHDLLNSVVTRMTAAGITLPDRQYVWSGAVAADCEQVVVDYEQSFQGLPGAPDLAALECSVLRTAQLAVIVLRCVPVSDASGTPPSETAMDDAGTMLLLDAHVLMTSVVAGYRGGDFGQTCDSLALLSVTPVGPSGGIGGTTLRLQAQF